MHRLVPSCLLSLIATAAGLPLAAAEFIVVQNQMIQLTEQSFEQNVFGDRRTSTAARQYAEQTLDVEVEFVDKAARLTDAQREKLQLAGEVDIHRYFCDYQRLKRGVTFGGIPRDQWQQLWQQTQPFTARFAAGLHGPGSLFAKTITTVLEPAQRERFDSTQQQRARAIYEDHIRMSLAILDRTVALTQQQRETLTELMVNNTSPPDFYGQSSMRYYVVLGKMAELPDDDLRELFSEQEWRVVSALLRQAKAMQRTLEIQRQALRR